MSEIKKIEKFLAKVESNCLSYQNFIKRNCEEAVEKYTSPQNPRLILQQLTSRMREELLKRNSSVSSVQSYCDSTKTKSMSCNEILEDFDSRSEAESIQVNEFCFSNSEIINNKYDPDLIFRSNEKTPSGSGLAVHLKQMLSDVNPNFSDF